MTPPADPIRDKNHRFPGEIISHGVWRYYRFPLSYRRTFDQRIQCPVEWPDRRNAWLNLRSW